MAIGVRIRFEIFKRDDFTCRYCGRRSPEVVLEVDHIVPVSGGGTDDEPNLVTSCWECNRGKSNVPLASAMTGVDPHDKAIEILERERQLHEYNAVLAAERERRENATWELVYHWKSEQGFTADKDLGEIGTADYRWLFSAMAWCPKEVVRNFMDMAIQRQMTKNLRYVAACCRNWRYEHAAQADLRGTDTDY